MGCSLLIPGLEQTQQSNNLMGTNGAAGTPHILSLWGSSLFNNRCLPCAYRRPGTVLGVGLQCRKRQNAAYVTKFLSSLLPRRHHHPDPPDEEKKGRGNIPELVRGRAGIPDPIPNLGSCHNSVPSPKSQSRPWIPAQGLPLPSSHPALSWSVAVDTFCAAPAQLPEMPKARSDAEENTDL